MISVIRYKLNSLRSLRLLYSVPIDTVFPSAYFIGAREKGGFHIWKRKAGRVHVLDSERTWASWESRKWSDVVLPVRAQSAGPTYTKYSVRSIRYLPYLTLGMYSPAIQY
jgi:hypothetical protein